MQFKLPDADFESCFFGLQMFLQWGLKFWMRSDGSVIQLRSHSFKNQTLAGLDHFILKKQIFFALVPFGMLRSST